MSLSDMINLDTISIPRIPDMKLEELRRVEERDAIVLGVREELMSNVMKLCHEIYLHDKTVDLVVDCTYESMKRIVYLEFFKSDEEQGDTSILWQADDEPETCAVDSWTIGNIGLKPALKKEESERSFKLTTTPPSILSSLAELVQSEIDTKPSSFVEELGMHPPSLQKHPNTPVVKPITPIFNSPSSEFTSTVSQSVSEDLDEKDLSTDSTNKLNSKETQIYNAPQFANKNVQKKKCDRKNKSNVTLQPSIYNENKTFPFLRPNRLNVVCEPDETKISQLFSTRYAKIKHKMLPKRSNT